MGLLGYESHYHFMTPVANISNEIIYYHHTIVRCRPDDDVEDDGLEEELDDSLHHGLDQVDPPRLVPRRLPAAGQHTPADHNRPSWRS